MNIKEILYSREINLSFLSLDEILDILKKDCSEIISIYKRNNKFFYRGEKKDYFFYKKTFPQNRRPRDTNIKIHNIIEETLSYLGFKARRSNSVFVISEPVVSSSYGRNYIFFPKNGFSFTWSSTIYDLYLDFSEIISTEWNLRNNKEIYIVDHEFFKLKEKKKQEKNEIIKELNEIIFDKSTSLKNLRDIFNYIIRAKLPSYDMLKVHDILQKNFRKLYESEKKYVYEFIGENFQNDDLDSAIRNHSEVLFTGEYYYMLDYTIEFEIKNKNLIDLL
ncbi:MAG: hypothetical protein NZZ41_00720 [Candidatus Dojkabacteria bacterium]|nr:hypothetical protein [Candidatus Dojkabacteria bacterium]